MPVDPNILLQGAALRAEGAKSFMNMLQEDEKLKAEKAKAGIDIEKLANAALYKQQLGVEPSPQEMAGLAAWDRIRTSEFGIDPLTKETYQKNRSLLDGMNRISILPEESPETMIDALASVSPSAPGNALPQPLDDALPAGENREELRSQPVRKYESSNPMANTPAGVMKQYEKELETVTKQNNPMDYSDAQLKAAGFASRMIGSNDIFASLPEGSDQAKMGTAGKAEAVLSAIPSAGLTDRMGQGIVKMSASPEQQKYLNAAQDWIRAKLRKESGAVISPQEMMDEYATYFPTPGDTAEVMAQKADLRARATEAMMKESAGAYDLQYGQGPDKPPAAPKAKTGEQRPVQEGAVIINKKTKQRMIMRGGQWRPI
jgi:hypothetical protein